MFKDAASLSQPCSWIRLRLRRRVAPVFARSLSFFAPSNGRRYFLLGAIGFLVRLPAVQGQLIWDDIYLTRENPFIKSPLLVLEAFRHYLFLDSFSGSLSARSSSIFLHVTAGPLFYRLLTPLFRKGAGLCSNDGSLGMRAQSVLSLFPPSGWCIQCIPSRSRLP